MFYRVHNVKQGIKQALGVGVLFFAGTLSANAESASNELDSPPAPTLASVSKDQSTGHSTTIVDKTEPVSIKRQKEKSTIKASDLCFSIAGKLSSVKKGDCTQNELVSSGGVSVSGLPIILKEYPPTEKREPRGRVLLIGGIHGDELSSISIIRDYFIGMLCRC